MTPFPPIPDGPWPIVQWARVIMQCLQERTLQESPDVLIERGRTGFRIRLKTQPGKGGGGGGDKPVWL